MIKSIIAAVGANNVIGKNNDLVWHLPADLKFFKSKTSGHFVIMGRKTFESFNKPLPNRTHIIITRQPDYDFKDGYVVDDLGKAFSIAKARNQQEAFVLGGGEIYKQAINDCDRLYITEIKANFDGDTFFPIIDKSIWKEIKREEHAPDDKNKYPYAFVTYEKA